MKFLILLLFISCASFHKERVIEVSSIDTLRSESLHRYDKKRLKNLLLSAKGLDKNLVLCHLGEHKKSLDDLSNKLDQFFQDGHYWNTISICYLNKEDYNKAKYYLEKGLSAKYLDKKTKASLHNNLGIIYLKGGMLHQAKAQFEKSLKTKKLLTTEFNLISLYLEYGMLEKAKRILFPLYERNSQDYDLIFYMGSYYLQKGKYKDALVFFTKLTPKNQRRNDVANAMAISYYQQKNYQAALQTLERRNKSLTETRLSSVSVELEKMINNKLKEVR